MNFSKQEIIELFSKLKLVLEKKNQRFQIARDQACAQNAWFIQENIDKAFTAVCDHFLDEKKLENWLLQYESKSLGLKIGLIMAGNIPLVGFHDLISVIASGHKAVIKLSSKDEVLMKYVLDEMLRIDKRMESQFEIVDRVKGIDAIIATGSNNSSRYFEYYFSKYPNIIRKNRNGTAVMTGNEKRSDLEKLSKDVFDYFGLGCRNITKIYVPSDYDFSELLEVFDENEVLFKHNKYRNNYDYNYALFLLNKEQFLASQSLLLKEDPSYLSRIACLHYEYYKDIDKLKSKLQFDRDSIQCIASVDGNTLGLEPELAFGQSQIPGLMDYADGVDTMKFLSAL